MNQAQVDEVRMRVTIHWVRGMMLRGMGGVLAMVPKHHLWFPVDDIENYELRHGNAPVDSMRPKYLRKLSLWLEPDISPDTREFVRPGGTIDRMVEEWLAESDEATNVVWRPGRKAYVRTDSDPFRSHAYRCRVIAEFCKRKFNPTEMAIQ